MPLGTTWRKWIRNAILAALFGVAATAVDAGDRHALLIGYNDYSAKNDLQPLKFAAKDVSDLRATLIEMGYGAEDITVLNAKDGAPVPTLATIREALEELKKSAGNEPDSSVMIVFAGHGFNYEGESYLCPADYQKERPTESSISVDEVSNVLAESQADGRYLIIDACRNESLSAGEAEFNLRTGLKKLRISQRNSAQGAVVLSSCVPGQQSWEIDQP
ncbi:MAG: caspase family protein, partial [Planctomycetota bacterium]